MIKIIKNHQGFSLVEIVLASGLLALLSLIFLGILTYGQQSTIRAGQRDRAIFLAQEGLEAARSIRDQNFTNLTVGNFGLSSSGQWGLVAQPDVTDIFTRTISVVDINSQIKKVTSKVQWTQAGSNSINVSFSTLFTDWRTASSTGTSTEFCP
ncbi:MAG: hypothetical protein NT034_01585 [Candidatus Magasanikbacteria bacterium]|nr:hypothetical protein [Candidatus Magasanikbacteria bacterium]